MSQLLKRLLIKHNESLHLTVISLRPSVLLITAGELIVGLLQTRRFIQLRLGKEIVIFLIVLICSLQFIPQSSMAQDRAFIKAQIQHWTEEVRKNPNDFETLAAIGAAYGKLGQHSKAIEYFKKAIEVNPSYAEAYLGLAAAYGFLGQIDEEISACKKVIALDPSNALAYAKLGSALGKAGRYKESIEALKEAIRINPNFPYVHFALGLSYLYSGDRNLARKQVHILKRLSPQLAQQLLDIIRRMNEK